jgi:hypothetical protein
LATVNKNFKTKNGIDAGGKITGPASTTAAATLNLPHGTGPSSPVNGDVWTTTSGIYVRVNGTTVGPLGAGGGGASVSVSDTAPVGPSAGNLWFQSSTGKTYIYYDSAWIEVGGANTNAAVNTDAALSNSWWLGV